MIFFFSRQIGLSPAGDAIPLLAGTRLTGRVGDWSVGALNIQQREKDSSPSTNFTALRAAARHPRQLRRRRHVAQQGSERVAITTARFGADANFRFFGDLDRQRRRRQERHAGGAGARRGRRLVFEEQHQLSRQLLGDARACTRPSARASTTRWGSCRASASTTSELYLGAHIRPRRFRSWMRETFPHIQFENFTRRNGGGLESRYMDWHWPITFQNSTFVEIGVNPNIEVIDEPLHDQQPPRHPRRPGPLRVQRELHPRQHQRRGAVLVQPALRQRRVLRRLPPQLQGRRRRFA